MRKAFAFAIFIIVLCAMMCTTVGAQVVADDRYAGYPRTLVQFPTSWPDLNQCKNQEFYEPLDTHLTQYATRAKIADYRVQQTDECVWMLTRNSWRWVLRPAGTKVAIDAQGRDLLDGGSPNGKICMNPRPISVPIPTPERQAVQVRPEPQIRFRPTSPPAPVYTPPPVVYEEPVPEPRRELPPPSPPVQPITSRFQTGATFGVVPSFSSFPVSGTLNAITGREWCIEGLSYDLGLAYGKPRSSYWRLTFSASDIKDGSFTRPEQYHIDVVNNVRVYGAKVERVFRIPLGNSPVSPMVSAGAGLGVGTGNAEEVFGSKYLFLGGAGVGALIDIGERASLGVTAIGYEHPGRHFGRVHLTVWF